MSFRHTDTPAVAAAKSGFSTPTAWAVDHLELEELLLGELVAHHRNGVLNTGLEELEHVEEVLDDHKPATLVLGGRLGAVHRLNDPRCAAVTWPAARWSRWWRIPP